MEFSLLSLAVLLTRIDRGPVSSHAVSGEIGTPNGATLHPGANLNSLNATGSPAVTPNTPPPEVPVRLVNGTSECSGWVELFHLGLWRPLCWEFWERKEADVICRQLGCGLARSHNHSRSREGHASFWVSLMNCTGTEADWRHCPSNMLPPNVPCDRNLSAAVTCTDHKEIRLAGGGSRCAGRVEINSEGSWGTVCDDSWDLRAAAVVCGQLGCGTAISAVNASGFGQGQGHIYLDEVSCNGTEAYLWHCPSDPWLQHDCGHKEDAGVVCSGHREIRLTGGPDPCSGRVSVRDQGTWGSLCDTVWGLSLAHGVCQYLGCGNASRLDKTYRLTGDHFWGDMCQEGTSEKIPACLQPLPLPACSADQAAGVVCTAQAGFEGREQHRNVFLLLIIGLLVFLLIILSILFVINYFTMRRRMVMQLAQPSHSDTAILTNDYREVSITTVTNNVKPLVGNVPSAAAQTGEDSDSFEDDYEDYDNFAPNHAVNFSTFKYSVRKQSERRNPPGNTLTTCPEGQLAVDDKGQRLDPHHIRSEGNASSSEEEGARAASANGGRRPPKLNSQRWKKQPSYKKSADSSSTSSCEWYENTTNMGNQTQMQPYLLAVPPQNEFQSSASTLPVDEYENVEDGHEVVTQPATPVAVAQTACEVADDAEDGSSESDYDDIATYFPS
ncbi:T-cell differentiation antigen CD6-like isoform X2 [Heterodontus francisci]|uniref:T-cell differentiation antigen CD6-like isoform X2 n=1 Tax=Heterodontus francisci TaxID=7792 RepID=UPI00355B286B